MRAVFGALAFMFCWLAPPAFGQASAALPSGAAGQVLVIGTKVAPPFVMKDQTGAWEGLSIDLWAHIAAQLGLHYRFQEESLNDLIVKTSRGQLNASIAAITVTAARDQIVDFSQPYYTTGLGIAVARGDSGFIEVAKNILTPTTLEVIAFAIGLPVMVGLIVWFIEREYNEHFGNHRTGLRSSLMWAALSAAGDAGHATPRTFPGQLIWLVWMIVSILLISSFTAVITSALTTTRLESRVQGMNDLRNVRTATVSGSAPMAYLKYQGIAAAGYPDLTAALAMLQAGKIDAVVYDRPLLVWTVRQQFSARINVIDSIFGEQNYAIALPTNSPLRAGINEALLQEMQADWWQGELMRTVESK